MLCRRCHILHVCVTPLTRQRETEIPTKTTATPIIHLSYRKALLAPILNLRIEDRISRRRWATVGDQDERRWFGCIEHRWVIEPLRGAGFVESSWNLEQCWQRYVVPWQGFLSAREHTHITRAGINFQHCIQPGW